MKNYLDLIHYVKDNGRTAQTRSGETLRVFDYKLEYDVRYGFPAVTTKRLPFNLISGELLWFLNGYTTLRSLRRLSGLAEDARTIWTDDYLRWSAGSSERPLNDPQDLGKLYGYQWRRGVDQVARLVDTIQKDPTSRYLRVEAWNPETVVNGEAALPPCHTGFTVFVEDGYLDLKWRQRSVDVFLGLPFNIASYALLLHILASITGLIPRRLIGDLDDVHIYTAHMSAVDEQLARTPKALPTLVMPEIPSLLSVTDLTCHDFRLDGYEPHPTIKAPLLVG
jgi:thymidylate synthase